MRTEHPTQFAQARARLNAREAEKRAAFNRETWSWIVAFGAMFLTDACWAFYVATVKDGAALAAAGWSVALFLLGAVAVIGYTKDRWLLVPASAGAFCGTLVAVALQARM